MRCKPNDYLVIFIGSNTIIFSLAYRTYQAHTFYQIFCQKIRNGMQPLQDGKSAQKTCAMCNAHACGLCEPNRVCTQAPQPGGNRANLARQMYGCFCVCMWLVTSGGQAAPHFCKEEHIQALHSHRDPCLPRRHERRVRIWWQRCRPPPALPSQSHARSQHTQAKSAAASRAVASKPRLRRPDARSDSRSSPAPHMQM